MIKPAINLNKDKKYYVACSGGVDSVAIVSYLMKNDYNISLLHFNHNFQESNDLMEKSVVALAEHFNISVICGMNTNDKIEGCSIEDALREERIKFFKQHKDADIIVCHHLNDCVESYVRNMFRGHLTHCPIPISTNLGVSNSMIRPFMLSTKEDFIKQVKANKLEQFVVEDKTNEDTKYLRNWIRHEVVPMMNKRPEVNLETTVKSIMNVFYQRHNLMKHDY